MRGRNGSQRTSDGKPRKNGARPFASTLPMILLCMKSCNAWVSRAADSRRR